MADDERARWQPPTSDPPSYGIAGLPAPPPSSSASVPAPASSGPSPSGGIGATGRNYSPADPGAARQAVVADPPEPSNGRATASLTLSIVGLALLVLSLGFFAFVSVPCSALGWYLGHRAQQRPGQHGMAQGGLVTGVIGTVLGTLALLGWVALIL